MILLGIDPGTAETGYGVIAVQGSRLDAVDHGVITTRAGEPLEERLAHIFAEITALLEQHAPASVALEDLFVGGNPRTILSVGHARGAVLTACGRAGVTAAGYPPAEVKRTVCGFGRADKGQVGRMVASLRGRVAANGAGQTVLDVGGVGYRLATTASAARMAADANGAEVTLL